MAIATADDGGLGGWSGTLKSRDHRRLVSPRLESFFSRQRRALFPLSLSYPFIHSFSHSIAHSLTDIVNIVDTHSFCIY